MAQNRDAIVMHHPGTGAEITAATEGQARVLAKSGWKKGAAPKKTEKKES